MERNIARKVHQDLSRLLGKAAQSLDTLAKAVQSLDSVLSYMDEDEDASFTADKCDEGEDRESDVHGTQ